MTTSVTNDVICHRYTDRQQNDESFQMQVENSGFSFQCSGPRPAPRLSPVSWQAYN